MPDRARRWCLPAQARFSPGTEGTGSLVLDSQPPVPCGDGCLSVWPMVCYISPNRPSGRCAERVEGAGSWVCSSVGSRVSAGAWTWAAVQGVECPRGHWGRRAGGVPSACEAPATAQSAGMAQSRPPREGCELPWVLSFQLQGNPGTSRVNPGFLPRSVCSSLCLAAPPWGGPTPGSEEPALWSPHALHTSARTTWPGQGDGLDLEPEESCRALEMPKHMFF